MLLVGRAQRLEFSTADSVQLSGSRAERRSCEGSGLDPHFDHVPEDEPLRSDKPFQGREWASQLSTRKTPIGPLHSAQTLDPPERAPHPAAHTLDGLFFFCFFVVLCHACQYGGGSSLITFSPP